MDHVLLVHGLWMRSFAMLALARHLRMDGFAVDTIDYASVSGGFDAAVRRVRQRLRGAGDGARHLVGHSLGALVSLEATRGIAGLPPGRTVCLGPPLRGSAAACALRAWPKARWLLGRNARQLAEGIAPWSDAREVGVIAGDLPLGFGRLLPGQVAPGDGTVALEETRLEGVAAHCTVHATHTGLLLSPGVAERVARFLRHGRFD
jgi:hypothetical protein